LRRRRRKSINRSSSSSSFCSVQLERALQEAKEALVVETRKEEGRQEQEELWQWL
jgi:hypothetical protein